MHRFLFSLSFASLALLFPTAAGQDSASQYERFDLFNACRSMNLLIQDLSDDAAAIGLTKEALQAKTESRLRAARLYSELGSADYTKANFAHLDVNVHVVGTAFHISVQYNKRVTDAFGELGFAGSWNSGFTGTHDGDVNYILSSLSQGLDRFLAAYMHVNEPACGSKYEATK